MSPTGTDLRSGQDGVARAGMVPPAHGGGRPGATAARGIAPPWTAGLLAAVAILCLGWAWSVPSAPVVLAAAGIAGLFQGLLVRWMWPSDRRRRPAAAQIVEQGRAAEARAMAAEMSLDRVRSVLDSLGQGVAVVDSVGEVLLTNPALVPALRMPVTAGRTLWEILQPELAHPVREAWRRLQETAGPDPPVHLLAVPCGDRVFDVTAVRARSSQSGHDFGTVFLLMDATRSHEIARLKDQFLSCIAHELRTPLTNICAYTEILGSLLPGESAEWPEFVRIVHEEGMRLSRLVDSMFDFQQLESGEAVLRCQALSLAVVARASVDAAAAGAAASGVDLDLWIDGDVPAVHADPGRMRQVLDLLVDNALKFTPGGGRVRVTVQRHEDGVQLRVDDSGPGIPADERDRVFEKFHQLADPQNGKPAGAGLGLATCRMILHLLHGTIRCEDSPLGGASVVCWLPAVARAPVATVPPTQPTPVPLHAP